MRVKTQPLFALLALSLAVAPSTSLAQGNNGLPVWYDQSYASIQDATRGGAPSRAVARGVDQSQDHVSTNQAEALIQQLRQDQDNMHALVQKRVDDPAARPAHVEEIRALSARIMETRQALDGLGPNLPGKG